MKERSRFTYKSILTTKPLTKKSMLGPSCKKSSLTSLIDSFLSTFSLPRTKPLLIANFYSTPEMEPSVGLSEYYCFIIFSGGLLPSPPTHHLSSSLLFYQTFRRSRIIIQTFLLENCKYCNLLLNF